MNRFWDFRGLLTHFSGWKVPRKQSLRLDFDRKGCSNDSENIINRFFSSFCAEVGPMTFLWGHPEILDGGSQNSTNCRILAKTTPPPAISNDTIIVFLTDRRQVRSQTRLKRVWDPFWRRYRGRSAQKIAYGKEPVTVSKPDRFSEPKKFQNCPKPRYFELFSSELYTSPKWSL